MKRLEGRVAVVTGGVQGIGEAYCRRFAEEGARIVIGDVQDGKGPAAVAALEAMGAEAAYAHCDVTKKAEVEALMDLAVERFGRLDICIANAAIVHEAKFFDLKVEDWDRVMRINVKGAFLTGQSAARRMIACGNGGVIINIASTNAMMVNESQVAYPISKGAVVQMTKMMAITLADHGIRANAIAPGPTKTKMLEEVMANTPTFQANIGLRTPLRRPAEPEEMANVAVFLASDESSYMTGQTLWVDGGRAGLNYQMPQDGVSA